MKEQLIRQEKAFKKYALLLIVISFIGIFGNWYMVTSNPAYKAAIETIKTSKEVLADVRKVEGFGFLPITVPVPDKETSAEYHITVFGEGNSEYGETDRVIHIALDKTRDNQWKVTYLSIDFVSSGGSGNNDIIILVALSTGILALIFLGFTFYFYLKKRKLLLNPNTVITMGHIVDVSSKMVRSTMPGESNHGVLRTDFENRAVTQVTEMFTPAVEFIHKDGTSFRLDHKFSSNKEYKKGDEIVVIYNTEAPQNALLKDFFWFRVHFLGIFGVSFTVAAFVSGVLAFAL